MGVGGLEIIGKYTKSCKVFANQIEDLALRQIETVANHTAMSGADIRIMPDCLPGETEVLTKSGFISIDSVSLKTDIACYNSLTGKVSFDFPTNLISRDLTDGENILRFCTPSGDMLVTKNHRMPFIPSMGALAKDIKDCKIKDFVWGGSGIVNPVGVDLTDDEIRLIVWVIGDGNIKITHNNTSLNKRIRFGFKKTRKINRVREILNKLKLVYRESLDSMGQLVLVLSTLASKKYISIVTDAKVYPFDWVTKLTDSQVTVLVDELIQVDGDYKSFADGRGYRISTTKKSDVDFLSALFSVHKGLTSTVHRSCVGFKDTTIYTVKLIPNSKLLFNKNGYHNRRIRVSEVKYNRKVYCLTCPTGFFIVRQQGLCFITGNCHAGNGCVVGFTAKLRTNMIIPSLIGTDIGCGVMAYNVGSDEIDFQELDDYIRCEIPSGYKIHDKTNNYKYGSARLLDMVRRLGLDFNKVLRSIGTLGGGNHFIEVDRDDKTGNFWFVVHTGSRNLGKQVYDYYQKWVTVDDGMPVELGYLQGDLFDNYIKDIKIAQEYADTNRWALCELLYKFHKRLSVSNVVSSVHNYLDDDMVMRKGAISASDGESVIIPWNMRDGVIIGVGLGNADWNNSAPHGAGRVLGRKRAIKELSLGDFITDMEGVWTSCVDMSTLDESPRAYKNSADVLSQLGGVVKVNHILRPVYNFKAGDDRVKKK